MGAKPMKNTALSFPSFFVLLALAAGFGASRAAENAAPASTPAVVDLNTPRTFPSIASREEWYARARQIREQVLVSCGLWPLPEKTPLHAQVFGRIQREGYTVEKVALETLPGFYLGGNLYRPVGKGPFPGVLNPHGHWNEGRFADGSDGSIAARCINFARQGMVAFSYDMVGYNDTRFVDSADRPGPQVHRAFATDRANLLWNIGPMALQTWNSIRALDFLESLPDVDRTRLACTGESGGGTQTFMLGAIEDRLAAQAPVVMVSHIMQGGCVCENAPGLRVEYSNMEIAAAAAPRRQILVAATGDWTRDTLTVEGPSIAHIYDLLGAADRFRYTRFDFGHNYNQTSREAVYRSFDEWLLQRPDAAQVTEIPSHKEPDSELRVFPDGKLPKGTLTQQQVIDLIKARRMKQWHALVPRNETGLFEFKRVMQIAWQHTLQVDLSDTGARIQPGPVHTSGGFAGSKFQITRPGDHGTLKATYWAPADVLLQPKPAVVVLADPSPSAAAGDDLGNPGGLVPLLLARGLAVLSVDQFSTSDPADQFANFYSTYNRTKVQSRVRDLLTLCTAARAADPRKPMLFRVILVGRGAAGPWTLLAAPGADAVAADCNQLDPSSDNALLAPDLFCPGLRNIGTLQGAAMLAAPHPLLLHNTAPKFESGDIQKTYRASGDRRKIRVVNEPVTDDDLIAWIQAQR